MKTDNNANSETSNEFITDSTLNIMLGAKVFSEKASDIFNTFLEKVKQSAETAYEKGSQIYENVALTAQNYIDSFRDRTEIRELKQRSDEFKKLMAFNWQVFTITLKINLGFGVVTFPPFIAFFLLGFVFLGILTWANYISNLQKIIYELEHGVKIGKMSDKRFRMKVQEQLLEEKNMEVLKTRLGIVELKDKQEELIKLMSEFKKGPEKSGGNQITQKDQNQKEH